MSLADDFQNAFSDVPEAERLAAILGAIEVCLERGQVIAVPDEKEVGEYLYVHQEHASRKHRRAAVSLEEIKLYHARLLREQAAETN